MTIVESDAALAHQVASMKASEVEEALAEELDSVFAAGDPIVAMGFALRDGWRDVYIRARACEPAALCLSGGGIRSAAFALGVIQTLAEADLLGRFDYLSTVSGGGYIGSWLSAWLRWAGDATAVRRALCRKDATGRPSREEPIPIEHIREHSSYLTSKVGLLSADSWAAVAIYLRNLLLNWLILVPLLCFVSVLPKVVGGLAHLTRIPSMDSIRPWIYVFSGIVVVSIAYTTYSRYAASPDQRLRRTGAGQGLFLALDLVPAVLAGACFAWLINHSGAAGGANPGGMGAIRNYLGHDLGMLKLDVLGIGGVVGAGCVIYAIGFVLGVAAIFSLESSWPRRAGPAGAGGGTAASPVSFRRRVAVLLGSAARSVRRISDRQSRLRRGVLDFIMFAVGGAAFGAVIWVGAHSYQTGLVHGATVWQSPCSTGTAPCDPIRSYGPSFRINGQSLLIVFGMPWFLLAMLAAQVTIVFLRSYSPVGDYEREWLGRAGGWYLVFGLGWIVMSALVLFGSDLVGALAVADYSKWLAPLGGVSGVVSALLGSSALTPSRGPASGLRPYLANIALAIAGPLFAAIAIIYLSIGFDSVVFQRGFQQTCLYAAALPADDGQAAGCLAQNGRPASMYWQEARHFLWALAALLAVELVACVFVNINRFSLHALYRNRLIRAFLGGPHRVAPPGNERRPNRFTGFDESDNIRMIELWPPSRPRSRDLAAWRPFHVINIALNLVATENLAWQQRKAESFTVTPLHCGAGTVGYRPTKDYGYPDGRGISLGTAMAISGAAASPNMGYHSSPSVTFLLAALNVRLGWWLGNPGKKRVREGEQQHRPYWWDRRFPPYRRDGPILAIRPFLSEVFGLTTDTSPYIYLSDGGHFENLGLYEMARRRCRWIVLSDAGQDGTYDFADLGDAVRKIWIDLGVKIEFPTLDLFREQSAPGWRRPRFAVGTVHYPEHGAAPGKILYLKPVSRGDEPADVVAYARAHPTFPHQSTADQMFDEPQFESYRALGAFTLRRLLDFAAGQQQKPLDALDLDTLFRVVEMADPTFL